jgi:hypothetical protein
MASSPPEAPARKLRWFQFSLRSLLLLVLLVSLGMSWVAVKIERGRQQKEAVEEIEKLGGLVAYDYQQVYRSVGPSGPVWLRNWLGKDLFATVVEVRFTSASGTDAELEHLKGMTQLQKLDLHGTQVTDAGLEHLEGMTKLQALWLHETKVSDAGLEYLKGMTQLQVLTLSGTKVTDAGLVHLEGLTQLEALLLIDTHVTHEGLKRLSRALPKCMIVRGPSTQRARQAAW